MGLALQGTAKARIGAGIALDVAGLALVVASLPEADWKLAAGLAGLLAGSWLVSSGLRGAPPGPASPADVERAAGRWRPEPELRAAPPRKVKLSTTAKVVAMAWLLMLAVGGAYSYVTIFARSPAPPSRGLLDAEGGRAQATVHRREVREGSNGGRRYSLFYNFADAEGSAVRSSVNVPKIFFDRYEEGDRLEVVYLAGDPIVHYLPELTRPAFAERGLLMAAVALAFLLYLLEGRRRRHYRLVREGAPVAGVAENVRRRGGARVFDVRFRANGREGSLRATERNPMRRDGDVLTVLTGPGSNDAELYSQCLYRAAE